MIQDLVSQVISKYLDLKNPNKHRRIQTSPSNFDILIRLTIQMAHFDRASITNYSL